jgi:TIR domain
VRAIFISYRRSDAEGEAGRLGDDLAHEFGSDSVFMDVDAIQPGRDFRKAIDESIASCGVLLAVIGVGWLTAKDPSGQLRLQDDGDWVRLETASALKRDIPVIPVLVRGAKMPRPEELPPDLKELAYRNGVELTHSRWRSDIQILINALRPLLQRPGSPADEAGEEPATAERLATNSRSDRGQQLAPSATGSRTAPMPELIGAAELERVTRDLAAYIGPVAGVVVKRAARRCSTVNDLYHAVAAEIESPADRAKFLSLPRD